MLAFMSDGASPEILAAGRSVLARYGYHGATAERLALAAGVSRVTLHRRGVTKDTILAQLTERAVQGYREALWPSLIGTGSAAERLTSGLLALCDQAEANMDLLIALSSRTDEIFHEPGEEAMTRSVFTEPIERLLRDGAQDGSLREVDAAETATVLFNLVGWTYIHLRTGHRWSSARARERVLEIALNGVLP